MQAQNNAKTRRKYDADFKAEVLKMLANGQTATYIAQSLGISENIIYRWKNKNQVGKKIAVFHSDLAQENHQLKERVRQLETEREILKKALSIFSRAT
jgi:transposase